MKSMKKKVSWQNLVLYGLIAVVTLMYLSLIFNDSLWGDEAYTMLLLKKDFVEMTRYIAAHDVPPPLYYYIAKIFTMILGHSVPVVKLASIVPVILTMILVACKAKKLFGESAFEVSAIFTLLLGLCPRAFEITIELRMYTWAMFFVTASALYAYEFYLNQNKKRLLIPFVLFSLGGAYVHHYATFACCFIYLFLYIALIASSRKNIKICVIFSAATVVGYLPWLPTFLYQFGEVRDHFWLTDENSGDIPTYIKWLFDGEFTDLFLFVFVLLVIGLISYLLTHLKDSQSWFGLLAVAVFVLVVAGGIFISKVVRPVFISRYMYVGFGLLCLGASIALSKNDHKSLLRMMVIALIVVNLPFSYVARLRKEYKNGTEEFKQFAAVTFEEEEILYTDVKHFDWTILPYYLPDYKVKKVKVNEKTRGMVLSTIDFATIQAMIPDAEVQHLFTGNVDNHYYFNIYRVLDKE